MQNVTSGLRNVRGDEARLRVLKSKINLFGILLSPEMKVIYNYLKPYMAGIILLIISMLALSCMEGLKSVSIIAGINSLFMDNLSSFAGLKILNRFDVGPLLERFKDKYSLALFVFGIFVILSILSVIVKYIESLLTRRFQLHLMRDLRRDLYNKIVSFDMDFFNEAKSGGLLFMINSEVSRFSHLILHSSNILSSFFTMFLSLAILFYMLPAITLFIAVFTVIFLFFHQKINRRLKLSSWQANLYQNTLQQLFYDIIYGIKLIKLGGLEERERKEYLDYHKKFEDEDLRMVKLRSLSEAARELFFILVVTLFCGILFWYMKQDVIAKDSAFIISYIAVLLRTLPYFSSFQRSLLSIIETYGPLVSIVDILTKPVEPKRRVSCAVHKDIGPIEKIIVTSLSFSYKEKDEILKRIDMSFTKGRMYAIVGFSGGGKSTLLDLMVGIRDPKRGRIIFNDVEIERIEPKVLNEKIAYANQEPLIFHDTLKENLIFFNKDVNREMIDKALEMASVKEFVYSLGDGLNTGLGERGLTVSGGERQRIGLARVFLKDAEILLLDEATNSLDYMTEKAIYDNLKGIKKDKIIIAVAHRLSSLVDFDEIYVVYNGVVEEKGSHADLMEKKGVYYSLYRLQETEVLNSKHEIRNPKQCSNNRNSNDQNK